MHMFKFKRHSALIAVLAIAAATAMLALPAAAGAASATVSNACANSVTANFSQIEVTTSGNDGLTSVAPGGATTTSGLTQSAAIPGDIFVAGYNLGLLTLGVNNIPANVATVIEGTNTTQGTQTTNTVGGTPPNGSVTVSTTISDPDGVPGGAGPGGADETATAATFSVSYNNLPWTAGGSGTIDYRQDSISTPAPPTVASNTLLINALVGGFLNVQFRCAPGTVLGMNPGVITLNPTAASFDSTAIGEPVENQAPVAAAGPDQTVSPGDLVTLDGSGSSDPDGDPLTYEWTAPAGVTLTGADTASPTFTAPTAPGALEFTLEVSDDATTPLSDTDTVTITVSEEPVENQAPVAAAGPDQTVSPGDLVTLDGSGSSDPDGDPLTYEWTAPAGVTLTGADTASPTFTAPTAPGALEFTLEVSDDATTPLSDTDTVTITVSEEPVENQAPVAAAGPDQTVSPGDLVTLDGSGSSDPDGDPLTYEWTAPAGVTLTGADTASPTFTAPTAPGALEFTLEVSDDATTPLSDTDTVTITVSEEPVENQAPVAAAGPDQTVSPGDLVTLDGSGSSDPDGDPLTYEWTAPAGVTLTGADTASPTFTAPTAPGALEFTLEVSDDATTPLSDTDTVTITVEEPVEGDVPAITNLFPRFAISCFGGLTVISGENFTGATSVQFGDEEASFFRVLDDEAILAFAPPQRAGKVHVTVTGPSGTSEETRADKFRYISVPFLCRFIDKGHGHCKDHGKDRKDHGKDRKDHGKDRKDHGKDRKDHGKDRKDRKDH